MRRARAAAAATLQAANAKAARARALGQEAAQRDLAVLGDPAGEIERLRADAFKKAAEAGGHLAAPPTLDVAPALAERQERARAAAAAMAAAEARATASLQAERTAAVEAEKSAEAAVIDAARVAMAEHADDVASRLDATMVAAFALADELEAIAMLSAPNYAAGENWLTGRIRLSPAASRRAATPMAWRPGLPGAQSYAGRRLPEVQQYFEALTHDGGVAVA